jgi:hypothetical protein
MENNSWHQKGEHPPVGTKCEYARSVNNFYECKILGSNGSQVAFTCPDEPNRIFVNSFNDCGFRPIKSDREKSIEEIIKLIDAVNVTNEQIAESLYDAGYRKVEDK